jgi:ribulose-5-phosphate 4-epimerase/fuculose-1-phosphate aldolase
MAERKLRARTLALNRKFTSTGFMRQNQGRISALMNHVILQSPGYV